MLYGILLLINSYLNKTHPLEDILKEKFFYWICATYSFLTSFIQVTASGCCIRLLCHLIHIIDIIKLNQKQQQQLYFIEPSVITTDHHHTSIRTIITNKTYIYPHFDHFFPNNNNNNSNHHNNSIVTNFLFWYNDHQQFIWDIILSFLSPIIYSILLFSFETYESSTLYLEYSSNLGCLPSFYQSKTSANMYYIYPFILLIIGCYYSVLLCIKLFIQRKMISSFKDLKKGTFFRLIVFCGLYNIFNFMHLPAIILGYMSNVINQKLPWSDEVLTNSKNGLIKSEEASLELIIFFGYPLLNFIWVLFFGSTKEALLLYHIIGYWIKNIYLNIKQLLNHYFISFLSSSSSKALFHFTSSSQNILVSLPLTNSATTLVSSSTSSNINDRHHNKIEIYTSQQLLH
ncbi:unnamed protein product [Cunninghamella blakesleeana]